MTHNSPAVEEFIMQELLVLWMTEQKLASALSELAYAPDQNRKRALVEEIAALQTRLDLLDSVLGDTREETPAASEVAPFEALHYQNISGTQVLNCA